ncbi:phosphotransferase [Rhizobium sp. AQ_MP]|uniref:phosphotransferase enzyme family protein n=1 Tax=Rhizobium sp. AQ_MP TaxID=2761536 RepID=UPI0016399074|nr:phosphotransferase [Rhizobium sp. AQ_MP]MBC2775304.1 phosphotransferase [Rhizobium sp. AQ_MP]
MLDFSPQYSTSKIADIESFIDRNYDLDGPVSCRLLQRGFNDVYLATDPAGARYVFRLSHHRARGPADVRSETAFLKHLVDFGVPVAAPIPTRHGALFIEGQAAEGLRQGLLLRAVGGRDVDPGSAADARANGKTLALLHRAAEAFQPGDIRYRLDLDHLLLRPLARIRDSGLVEDLQVLDRLEGIANRTAASIEAMDDLAWTYCHGDCHGFNARIDDAGEAVFFDFDDSGPGYLAYDLAVFLWAKVSFGRELTAMWHEFLDAYQEVRKVAQVDLTAVPHFVIIRHFWLMGEYASRAHEWGCNSVGWVAGEVDTLTRWETEHLALPAR